MSKALAAQKALELAAKYGPTVAAGAYGMYKSYTNKGPKGKGKSKKKRRGRRAIRRLLRGAMSMTKTKKRKNMSEEPVSSYAVYQGNVKVKRRKIDDSYNVRGCVIKIERSGTIDATQTQYLGHSTCAARVMLDNMCRCVVKELMHQTGVHFENWSELWNITALTGNLYKIRYGLWTRTLTNNFSADENPELTYFEVIINSTDTFDVIARNLASDIHAGLVSLERHIFYEFALQEQSSTAVRREMASIKASQFYLTVAGTSVLKFQNATEAAAGTTDPDDSKDNIRGNPLSVRVYSNSKQTGLEYKFRKGATPVTTRYGFVANEDTGVIQFDPSDLSIVELYKPPKASAFSKSNKTKVVSATRDFVIDPGAIKTSYTRYKKSFSWNGLFYHLEDTMANTRNHILPIGSCKVLAFEHNLKVSGDPNVTVAYQHDLTMMMKYKYKPVIKTAAILDI